MSQMQMYPALMAQQMAAAQRPPSQTRAPGFYGGSAPANLPGYPAPPSVMNPLSGGGSPQMGGSMNAPGYGNAPVMNPLSGGNTGQSGGPQQPPPVGGGAGMGSWNGQTPAGQGINNGNNGWNTKGTYQPGQQPVDQGLPGGSPPVQGGAQPPAPPQFGGQPQPAGTAPTNIMAPQSTMGQSQPQLPPSPTASTPQYNPAQGASSPPSQAPQFGGAPPASPVPQSPPQFNPQDQQQNQPQPQQQQSPYQGGGSFGTPLAMRMLGQGGQLQPGRMAPTSNFNPTGMIGGMGGAPQMPAQPPSWQMQQQAGPNAAQQAQMNQIANTPQNRGLGGLQQMPNGSWGLR